MKTRWSQRRKVRGEAGDTLIEILIALVIISITVVALLGGLVTALTSSSEHRSVANLDTLLKDFAEAAKYEIQEQPVTGSSSPLFTSCATGYSVASAPSPAETAVGLPAGDGVPITMFVTNLTPGLSVIPGVNGGSVTLTSIATGTVYAVPAANFPTGTGADGAANGTVASSGPFAGSASVTFYPPAIPGGVAGKYTVMVSDGTDPAATAGEHFTTAAWVGPPTLVSGNEYSVALTGYDASVFVSSVTVGGHAAAIDSGQQLSATGTSTLDFTIPAGSTGSVQVQDQDGTAASSSTAIGSSATTTGSLGSTSISLAGYALSITGTSSSTSGVMWWDTSSNTWDQGTAANQASCQAGGSPDNNGIQLITAVAAGPNGYTDSLSFVVTQPGDTPNYPSVTSVSPSSVKQGNSVSVTVTGTGFNNPWVEISGAGDTGVTPSALTAPTSWTATQIVFTVNAAPGTVNTNYNITVSNNGGAGPSGSCWSCFTVTPGLATPTNVVTPSTSSPTPGQSVTFTATITGTGANNPATGGSVTWTVSGSATSCNSNMPLTAGAGATATATCTITMGVAGSSYTVSDSYSGNADYTSVTSSPKTVTVGKYTPTVVVTNLPTNPSFGASETFTVTVTGSTGGPDPTGTITWTLNGPVTSCATTTPLTPANPATATCTITTSGAGTYTANASYPGDGNYSSVTSNTVTFTVGKYTPSVTVTGVVSGSMLTFTATVTGTGGVTPTGTTSWTVSYTSGRGGNHTVNCSSMTGPTTQSSSSVTYTCVINNPSASDTYTATAMYGGDANYNSASKESMGVAG